VAITSSVLCIQVMVSHKVLEFGDDGYKLPAQARAPRSVRVNGYLLFSVSGLAVKDFISYMNDHSHVCSHFCQKKRIYEKKIPGDDKMCAIDLLATVAGSLLLESKSPVNACLVVQNTVKNEFPADENPVKALPYSESPSLFDNGKCGFSSVITNPIHLLVGDKVGKEVEGFSSLGVSGDVKPDVVASIGSNSSTEVGACGNGSPNESRDDVNLFSRNDDDENFSGYIRTRMTRPVPRIGDRRIRKILASRHWKGGSKNNAGKIAFLFSFDCLRYCDLMFGICRCKAMVLLKEELLLAPSSEELSHQEKEIL